MKYILMTFMSILALSITACGDKDEDTAAEDTAALDAGVDTGDDQDGGSDDE